MEAKTALLENGFATQKQWLSAAMLDNDISTSISIVKA